MFLTDWGTYSTSLSFAFYPTCIFMITKPLSSTSSYDHFPLSHLSHIFWHLSCLFSCMLCAITYHWPPTIIRGLLLCLLLRLFHIIWLPKRVVDVIIFLFYFFLPTTNHPFFFFFRSFCILRQSGVFCYSCCCFCCQFLYLNPPNNMSLCGHICRTCCTLPLRTFHSCYIYFLQCLMLAPSLMF